MEMDLAWSSPSQGAVQKPGAIRRPREQLSGHGRHWRYGRRILRIEICSRILASQRTRMASGGLIGTSAQTTELRKQLGLAVEALVDTVLITAAVTAVMKRAAPIRGIAS